MIVSIRPGCNRLPRRRMARLATDLLASATLVCGHGALAQDSITNTPPPWAVEPGVVSPSDQGTNSLLPLMRLRGQDGLVTRVAQLVPSATKRRHPTWRVGTRHVGQTERWDLYSSVSASSGSTAIDIWHVPRKAPFQNTATGNPVVTPSLPVIRSRLALTGAKRAHRIEPRWWPILTHAWSGQTNDGQRRITTMLGWQPGSLGASSRFIRDRARAGGLTPVRRVPIPGDPQSAGTESMPSELIVLAAPGAELVVTLTAESGRVGVVAHWVELITRTP